MLFINRYSNLKLRNELINFPKKQIVWIKDQSNLNEKIWTGRSKLYSGINRSFNLSQCLNEQHKFIDIIDYNYSLGSKHNYKMCTNFHLEQYHFESHDEVNERNFQITLLNKIIFNNTINSSSLLEYYHTFIPSYKFIYYYYINGPYNFVYRQELSNSFYPKENDIICIDNTRNHSINFIDLDKFSRKPILPRTFGILVMTIPKIF